MKIYSLNCRSLRKHYLDIISDNLLLKSDIICLQETWLEDDVTVNELEIEHYALHLNSNGRGKGLAIYYKKDTFKHEADVKEQNKQLSKFKSSDILVTYRFQNGNLILLKQHLEELINREKPTMVVGDFNFCFLEDSSQSLKNYLTGNFSQLVKEPTHIEGNLLDQAHLRDTEGLYRCSVELHTKYYTDHRGVALLMKRYRNICMCSMHCIYFILGTDRR